MDMVQVQGKCNRRVPIILTPDCQKAMEILVKKRDCFIPESNKYFFASMSDEGHIDEWQTVNKLAKEAGCTQPDLITCTKLRKYCATVLQVRYDNHCIIMQNPQNCALVVQ